MDTNKNAYGLPSSSIRAILALMVFGVIWYLLITSPHVAVPSYLQNLMFIIMGHYFATRSKDTSMRTQSPLNLPRGSIRWIIALGFLSVAVVLIIKGQLSDDKTVLNPSIIMLVLVAGFMLGVVRSQFKRTLRVLEDIKATLAIMACLLLVLLTLHCVNLPQPTGYFKIFSHFGYEEVFAALVGFYFGSKS